MWSVRRRHPLCFSVNGSVVYDNATEANPGDVGLVSEASDEGAVTVSHMHQDILDRIDIMELAAEFANRSY